MVNINIPTGKQNATPNTLDMWKRLQSVEDSLGAGNGQSVGTRLTNVESSLADKASQADLNGTVEKLKTISLNLADYADFSTLADYADITSIVQSALSSLPSLMKGTTGWKLFNVSVFVPGGHWTVKQKRLFDLSKYGSLSAVRGFNLYGAGYENTEIIFDNNVADSDNYLIYNNDNFGYTEIKNIRFTSKNNVEKFMYNNATAAGNASSFIFKNLTIYGFQEGIRYDGSIMCSEIDYYSLKFLSVPAGGWGIYCNNTQSVNHNFFACEFEAIAGVGLEFNKGGCANFYGGSYIPSSGGVIFKTTDNSGANIGTSNHTFNFYGIRTEMNGTSMIFDIASNVDLTFDGCNLNVEKSSAGSVRGILGPYKSYVTFKNCDSRYKYQVRVNDSSYNNGACKVYFDNCTLNDQLSNLVTLSGSTANTAGYPLIEAFRTRSPITSAGQKTMFDSAIYKTQTNLSPVIPVKSVFLRTGADSNGGLPNNSGGTFTLPLHAIITKIRIVHNNSILTGTFSYDVKNNDGTITFVSLANVANNSPVSAISNDLWYVVDTEAKRTIQIVQSGTNSTQNGYIVVDYI